MERKMEDEIFHAGQMAALDGLIKAMKKYHEKHKPGFGYSEAIFSAVGYKAGLEDKFKRKQNV